MHDTYLLDLVTQPGALAFRYQPVLERGETDYGLYFLESLCRGPRGTNVERADVLFEYVRRKREERRVDRLCFERAIAVVAPRLGANVLSVNIHASTLGAGDGIEAFLLDTLESRGVPPSQLVVEINEHLPVYDVTQFLRTLDVLRGAGSRIAVDDVGIGQSNFRMILDCKPDYLKIDRYIVQGCDRDLHRRAIVESAAALANRIDARVVAEGVETVDELGTLHDLGITLFQGFLLCRPLEPNVLDATGLMEGGRVRAPHGSPVADPT